MESLRGTNDIMPNMVPPAKERNWSPLKAAIVSVTTAQPTVATTSKSMPSFIQKVTGIQKTATSTGSSKVSKSSAKVPKLTPKNNSASKNSTSPLKPRIDLVINGKGKGKGPRKRRGKNEPININSNVISFSDVSVDSTNAKQEANLIMSRARSKASKAMAEGSSFISNGISSNCSSSMDTKYSDDEDLDVDIDIENDDSGSVLLKGQSASPGSIYQQLLRSAQIDVEVPGHSGEPHLEKYSKGAKEEIKEETEELVAKDLLVESEEKHNVESYETKCSNVGSTSVSQIVEFGELIGADPSKENPHTNSNEGENSDTKPETNFIIEDSSYLRNENMSDDEEDINGKVQSIGMFVLF